MGSLVQHILILSVSVCLCVESDVYMRVQLPVFAVLGFGVYSVVSIVYSIVIFRDVPEELEVLQKDIAVARKELKRKGFTPPVS